MKILNILFLSLAFLLTGCVCLVTPIEYAINAFNYEKDVSKEPQHRYIIGKTFKLKKDITLKQFPDNLLYFDPNGLICCFPPHKELGIIPSGTELLITKITETNMSHGKSVFAEIKWLDQTVTVFANSLFKDTYGDKLIIENEYIEELPYPNQTPLQ